MPPAAQRSAVVRAATITGKAAALLGEIVADDRAANALLDLLNLKDTAQYGLIPITGRVAPSSAALMGRTPSSSA